VAAAVEVREALDVRVDRGEVTAEEAEMCDGPTDRGVRVCRAEPLDVAAKLGRIASGIPALANRCANVRGSRAERSCGELGRIPSW
jgi:hypothetical protein